MATDEINPQTLAEKSKPRDLSISILKQDFSSRLYTFKIRELLFQEVFRSILFSTRGVKVLLKLNYLPVRINISSCSENVQGSINTSLGGSWK